MYFRPMDASELNMGSIKGGWLPAVAGWLGVLGCLWGGVVGGGSVAWGQADTEFWFVAPEVWAGHGDSPALLRFATFGQAAVVTVNQPANPAFPVQTLNIPANSAQSLNLGPWLNLVENKPANSVLNLGLKITSTSLIQAYYEVNPSNNLNPDIFVLKGDNALGTNFVVPFQTYLTNAYTQSPASFDIVATVNNTQVTITPKKAIVGHAANVPFTITLNAGQTWSGRAINVGTNDHPSGTLITSNQPIAVTMSDDSLNGTPYGGCADIAGDQLVPVNVVGMEYIAIKGDLNGPDRVFLVATEPNTVIYVNGVQVGTLAQVGTAYSHQLSAAVAYYTASKPVCVLHITGFGCEVGGAILPPIDCTGSQEVVFVRSTNEFLGLKILVPTGGEDDFTFNGNAATIPASSFVTVPGTAGAWKYANIVASAFAGVLQASRIVNSTSFFHLGIVHGGASSGTRYGYFSNYAERQYTAIVTDNTLCVGDGLTLAANTIPGASYEWTGPNGPLGAGNPLDLGAVDLTDVGTYVVSGSFGTCPIESDSLDLFVYAVPEPPAIAAPGVLCEGEDLVLTTGDAGMVQYLWSGPNGPMPGGSTLTVADVAADDAGVFQLVLSDHGCLSEPGTATVEVVPHAEALIVPEEIGVCAGAGVELAGTGPAGAALAWVGPGGPGPGGETWSVGAAVPGWYVLGGVAAGCPLGADSVWVDVEPLPAPPALDLPVLCAGTDGVLLAGGSADLGTVSWYGPDGNLLGTGAGWPIAGADPSEDGGTYSVTVTSPNGCVSPAATGELVVVPLAAVSILGPGGNGMAAATLCQGEGMSWSASGPAGGEWVWTAPNGVTTQGTNFTLVNAQPAQHDGVWTLSGVVDGCPTATDALDLTVNPTPPIPVIMGLGTYCEGEPANIYAVAGSAAGIGATYTWTHPGLGAWAGTTYDVDAIPLLADGTFSVVALLNGCPSAPGTGEVEVVALPAILLEDFAPIDRPRCPDEAMDLAPQVFDPGYNYTWTYQSLDGGATTPWATGPGTAAGNDGVYTVLMATGAPCNRTAQGAYRVETIVCELLVPNVISPNGDDSNEVFEVPGMDRFPGSTCRIYNRWGGEVFRSDAFGTSPGWAPGADDAAEGTYFYEIIVARTDGVLFISDADGFREITQPGPVPLVGTLTVVR
jgi:hypothetical protein